GAFACSLATIESSQGGAEGVHAGGDIGDGDADLGRVVRAAGDGDGAGFGLEEEVIGLAVAVGAVFAVAGNGNGDEAGVAFVKLVDAEANAVEGAGGEVLDHDIGVSYETLGDVAATGLLYVKGEAALTAVEPGEPGGSAVDGAVVGAGEVSLTAALYLDDI